MMSSGTRLFDSGRHHTEDVYTHNVLSLKFCPSKDPIEGEKDLENKIIKAVGDPSLRFKEDALRLLRAVRIATQLNFKIEDKTWEELKKDAKLLEEISKERVRIELIIILERENPYEGIILLEKAGLLQYIVP